jgi:myo-inositol-1(or 4)-monophosphatase
MIDAARLEFAIDLAREAGALALEYFGQIRTLAVTSKGPQDMASAADLAVEELIKTRLAAAYPDDTFLGEETGLTTGESDGGIWVVDPIDGTQPFLCGLRTWCVSIAYVRDDRVRLGVVFNPAADELFVGGLGVAASLNGQPIVPSPATTVADGLTFLGYSSRISPEQVVPVLDRLLQAGGMFVRSGSGALGLCDVACGRLVGYVEAHLNSWDGLGALAVCEAAGVRINDYLTGDALLRGNHVVAGPPAVFDELTSILGIAPISPPEG